MPTRDKALLYLANNLLFWVKTLLFWAKTLLVRAKIIKVCRGRELMRDQISELPDESMRDQISELPDEIKICILSLLSMKEAGQTSVLSKKWRDVWYYIPVLNFDGSDTLSKLLMESMSSEEDLLEVEKPRYFSWVNQVVGSYKGSTIDEFRVRFDISVTNRLNIDDWVKFAMEKRVKRLELDFRTFEQVTQDDMYTFGSISISNSLTSLRLASINITDESLQSFLEICPNLEYLSVVGSKSLENLVITGSAFSLKYLEILLCFRIKFIEISAPNLVSFKYKGPKISLPFKRTPRLVKLSVGGTYGRHVTNNFSELSSYFIQLEALALDINFRMMNVMKSADQFPRCINLKQMEVTVNPDDGESLLCFAPLIKACPFLHEFVLKLGWCNLVSERPQSEIDDCPHYHLKILEIVGFIGNAIDLEFIMYIIKNCVALEKIVINPGRPGFIGTPWEFDEDTRITATTRDQAEKLRKKLKHGIDLIIL